MIVVEAAACGTPSIVVREPDNAAVELVERRRQRRARGLGLDPRISPPRSSRVLSAGEELRGEHASMVRSAMRGALSIESSLERVLESYRAPASARR